MINILDTLITNMVEKIEDQLDSFELAYEKYLAECKEYIDATNSGVKYLD